MDDTPQTPQQPWETPEFVALTDTGVRADQPDVAQRNGLFLSGGD